MPRHHAVDSVSQTVPFHLISAPTTAHPRAPANTYLPAHTRYRSSSIPNFTGSPQSANGAMGRVRPDGQQRSNCTSLLKRGHQFECEVKHLSRVFVAGYPISEPRGRLAGKLFDFLFPTQS
jgi:hypothetical protein